MKLLIRTNLAVLKSKTLCLLLSPQAIKFWGAGFINFFPLLFVFIIIFYNTAFCREVLDLHDDSLQIPSCGKKNNKHKVPSLKHAINKNPPMTKAIEISLDVKL